MITASKTLGNYRIVRELGRGSFGVVQLAYDISLGEPPVALKILYPHLVVDPSTVGLSGLGAATMAHLDCPQIVAVYEEGDIEGVTSLPCATYLAGCWPRLVPRKTPSSWSVLSPGWSRGARPLTVSTNSVCSAAMSSRGIPCWTGRIGRW